jgi:transposase
MAERRYPSDLDDAEWAVVRRHLPRRRRRRGGRPRAHARRAVLDGVFYVVRTGCQWRQLPREYPPWKTVYHYWRAWRLDGTWARLCRALVARARARAGRNPQPGAGVVDTQSVKATGVGGVRGWDPHKHLKGRKRHILVDGQGLLLRVAVHTAGIHDRAGLPLLLEGAPRRFPRLRHLWADRGYAGQVAGSKAWVERELGWTVDLPPARRGGWARVPAPPALPGVPSRRLDWARIETPARTATENLRPRRWVVERTFAWLGHSRRLSKEYERLCATSECAVYAAFARLLARRLTRT